MELGELLVPFESEELHQLTNLISMEIYELTLLRISILVQRMELLVTDFAITHELFNLKTAGEAGRTSLHHRVDEQTTWETILPHKI